MSTIIDRYSLGVRAVRFGCGMLGVVIAWFAALAAFTLLFEPESNVTMFGPMSAQVAAVESAEVKILSSGAAFMTVVGQQPGFVRALYAGGAWLVLPAMGRGCGMEAFAAPTIVKAAS